MICSRLSLILKSWPRVQKYGDESNGVIITSNNGLKLEISLDTAQM